jgi:hypothetical protein
MLSIILYAYIKYIQTAQLYSIYNILYSYIKYIQTAQLYSIYIFYILI